MEYIIIDTYGYQPRIFLDDSRGVTRPRLFNSYREAREVIKGNMDHETRFFIIPYRLDVMELLERCYEGISDHFDHHYVEDVYPELLTLFGHRPSLPSTVKRGNPGDIMNVIHMARKVLTEEDLIDYRVAMDERILNSRNTEEVLDILSDYVRFTD